MTVQQFRLPDLGEGLTEGDLVAWTVAVGDTVAVNDTIAEVETVKAAVELPSPYAGVVTGLHASAGDTVPVGTPIISIEVAGDAAADTPSPEVPASPEESASPEVPVPPEDAQPTLVGYGPRPHTVTRRRRRRAEPSVAPSPAAAAFDPAPPATSPDLPVPTSVADTRVLAKPPVRKLARTLGVELATITATGPNGTITRDDVSAAVPAPTTRRTPAVAPVAAGETRIPVRGVRRHTAAAMVASAFTAPHVTEFVSVDVTASMQLRERLAERPEFRAAAAAGVRVSPLLLVARAVVAALSRTPELNASWDEAAGEIVLKHDVNLGIAAATPRGLVVPNVKQAQSLSLLSLAEALAELAATARAGRTAPSELTGGTFTISNVGVFGVDTGTPILNPGESGILALGAVRRMPWVVGTGADERIEARWVTQLALSFDHRVVDGEQGSHFLADVAAALHDPALAVL